MSKAPNPKDSMKSTWRTASRDTWTWSHWIFETLDGYPTALDKPVPKHPKTDKIPYLSQWSQHVWVLVHAVTPLLVHQAILTFTGRQSLHPLLMFLLYFNAFNIILIREVHTLRKMGHRWGFLDGDVHDRDGIPDASVTKVLLSALKGTGGRVALAIYFSYDRAHPNPLMTAFADEEQEFFDLVGIPFLTYMSLRAMGLPLGFYEWWLCHQYIAFIEVAGHSGLRLHAAGLSTFHPILQYFNAEIVVEDHDMHHRKGWRKSHNYGKQTRLWDRVFGTCLERVESAADNVDYVNPAHVPLF
ncbi:hypothetical protein H634G_10133 [Metarhizium anisopliae BRIP 53293]|uniref:Fatty acid hydroxylase domain-containing protein n=1 Tax=Metarhizium anisopliae BRIP 53293 TaxID=1291518 RepID=A0A0D9NKZ4_METAN|nr:hypothetical protein H634G_10133 [Metarhizium anisopliae BRIP 53293]